MGDGGPATEAAIRFPRGLAVGPDGALYISDSAHFRVRHIGPDGIITTIAGTGVAASSPDGGRAAESPILPPQGLVVARDGSVYFSELNAFSPGLQRVRIIRPDGVLLTAAGSGEAPPQPPIFVTDLIERGPASRSILLGSSGLALGPDNSLYLIDGGFDGFVRRIAPPMPGFQLSELPIADETGRQVFVFDTSGRHHRTIDARTAAILYRFDYDVPGHLSAITDRDGNVTTIERDAAGWPTTIIAPFGQRTTLTVDVNGYLTRFENPAGETTQMAYTADGLLTVLTTPRGHTSHFTYDAMGRLTKDDGPAGGSLALEHLEHDDGLEVRLTTALDRTTSYRSNHTSTGEERRLNTLPDGTQDVLTIRPDWSLSSTTPDGMVVALTQGPDPRFGMQAPLPTPMSVTTPSQLAMTIATSRAVTLADPQNVMSLSTEIEATTVNGRIFTRTFNAAARTLTMRTPLGREVTSLVNEQVRLVERRIPGLLPVQLAYDPHGRLSMVTQGSRAYTMSYNAEGYLSSIADPLSRTRGFSYDLAGRITTQRLPDGHEVSYAYDDNGNATSITPPQRPSHVFTYTPVDLRTEYIPPTVGVGTSLTRYAYNVDRQLTDIAPPDGRSVHFDYDSGGRLATIGIARGQIRIDYDAAGRIAMMTSADGGRIAFAYDGFLLRSSTWTGTVAGSISQTYDANFHIASQMINETEPIPFHYDADGLLIQAGALTLTHDPHNGLFTGSGLDRVTDTLAYTSFGEPSRYTASVDGAARFDVQYVRDALGRIIEQIETLGGSPHTTAYQYDMAGRLTDIATDGLGTAHYEYDDNGNRLQAITAAGIATGTYDVQDRLLRYGPNTYTYTAHGQLQTKTNATTGEATTYTYDELGNLLAVSLPDGTRVEYIVDGLNRRIGKKVNGAFVQGFLYQDRLRPAAELDGAGGIVSRFVYGRQHNVPDYMEKSGSTYRLISDHLGSPRLVINTATGQVVQRMDYDEFGNIQLDTNPGFQPFGFASGLYDPQTQLIRFGARDYEPQTGRWTVKDPILFAGGDTNLYGYVLNDPMNLSDVTGLDSIAHDLLEGLEGFAMAAHLAETVGLLRPLLGFGSEALSLFSAPSWLYLGFSICVVHGLQHGLQDAADQAERGEPTIFGPLTPMEYQMLREADTTHILGLHSDQHHTSEHEP